MPTIYLLSLHYIWLVLQALYDFAFSCEQCPHEFRLVANFPRKIYDLETFGSEASLESVGIQSQAMLFVQDLTEDDSDWNSVCTFIIPSSPRSSSSAELKQKSLSIVKVRHWKWKTCNWNKSRSKCFDHRLKGAM